MVFPHSPRATRATGRGVGVAPARRSALLLACLLAGCGSSDETESRPDPAPDTANAHGLTPEQAAAVAAKIGSTELTVGEVADALDEQSPYLRARYASPERRREFLDHLVKFELLVQEAERRGYRDRAEVADARDQALVSELMREEIDSRVRLEDVTDADVRAYFEAHPGEYDQPEQMRASHILLRDRARAERVLAEVKAAPGDMALFRRIALERSEDPETRSRGGDLRFFSRPPAGAAPADWHGPDPAIARAAFELTENGQVFDTLVETPAGFHVVARTAYRPAMRRTLDEVARVIRHRIHRDRRDAAVDALLERLRSEARIETHPEVLATVRIPERTTQPGEHDEHAGEEEE